MYQNINNVAYINGNNGIYDGKIANNSVRMARNSVANYKGYLYQYVQPVVNFPDMSNLLGLSQDEFQSKMNELDASIKQLQENEKNRPPLNFVQRYMGVDNAQWMRGTVDKDALMAAAYEEMGKRLEMPVSELTQGLQDAFDGGFEGKSGVEFDASVLDRNKDGMIGIDEYGACILASDALSTDSSVMNAANIDGIVTDKGEEYSLRYAMKNNYDLANRTYQALYDYYGLKDAKNQFIQNQNNLI